MSTAKSYRTKMCAQARTTYTLADHAARAALDADPTPVADHVRGVLSGAHPSSYSHLRGEAAKWRGSYVRTLYRTLARLRVPCWRAQVGSRVVLYLGTAWQPCPPPWASDCSKSTDDEK